MQFLFHGRPKAEVMSRPPTDLMEKVKGDWMAAFALYQEGLFRQIWMSDYGVVAICEAESKADLEAKLAQLPLALASYIDIDIHELKPYQGFAPRVA